MNSSESRGQVANINHTCACKNTCSKKDGTKKKGCPCKTAKTFCSTRCKCGTKRKQCVNKEGYVPPPKKTKKRKEVTHDEQDNNMNTSAQTSSTLLMQSEEDENQSENNHVKAFLDTLDEPMIKQLALCCLQRGVGSMDYIHSLMVRMYDNDEDKVPQLQQENALQEPSSPPPIREEPLPDWCKCGKCCIMAQEIENKCCRRKKCVTHTRRFRKFCLDPEYLQLSCRNVWDIRNDREDNSTRSFRKQAYRHYILDTYGYLGKGNRRVAPSCVVTCIRRHYPSPTGVYMGFKEH